MRTMDRPPESMCRPGMRVSEHGLDIVTIKVGHEERSQVFKIHKNLLCKSSEFFKASFDGHFLESETGYLELKTVDPMTFEVLYQWLYSGSTRNIQGFAAESDVDIDLLWLRVFSMAHEYMINTLQEISFFQFRQALHDFHRVVPSATCVNELYESDLPANLVAMLKSYLILHCAYWITDNSCSCWEWQQVLKHPEFGADIAWELTKRGSKDYVGVQSHPRYNVKFANHNGHVFIKKDNNEDEPLQEPWESLSSHNEGGAAALMDVGKIEDANPASD